MGNIYLGKEANNVKSIMIEDSHDVKQERICVIVQGLVIKKQLCQET